MTHAPVSTLADLATLDDDEVLEGYRDGLAMSQNPAETAPAPTGMDGGTAWRTRGA